MAIETVQGSITVMKMSPVAWLPFRLVRKEFSMG